MQNLNFKIIISETLLMDSVVSNFMMANKIKIKIYIKVKIYIITKIKIKIKKIIST